MDHLLSEARATIDSLANASEKVTWDNFAAKL
jgi:hypothetical protein